MDVEALARRLEAICDEVNRDDFPVHNEMIRTSQMRLILGISKQLDIAVTNLLKSQGETAASSPEPPPVPRAPVASRARKSVDFNIPPIPPLDLSKVKATASLRSRLPSVKLPDQEQARSKPTTALSDAVGVGGALSDESSAASRSSSSDRTRELGAGRAKLPLPLSPRTQIREAGSVSGGHSGRPSVSVPTAASAAVASAPDPIPAHTSAPAAPASSSPHPPHPPPPRPLNRPAEPQSGTVFSLPSTLLSALSSRFLGRSGAGTAPAPAGVREGPAAPPGPDWAVHGVASRMSFHEDSTAEPAAPAQSDPRGIGSPETTTAGPLRATGLPESQQQQQQQQLSLGPASRWVPRPPPAAASLPPSTRSSFQMPAAPGSVPVTSEPSTVEPDPEPASALSARSSGSSSIGNSARGTLDAYGRPVSAIGTSSGPKSQDPPTSSLGTRLSGPKPALPGPPSAALAPLSALPSQSGAAPEPTRLRGLDRASLPDPLELRYASAVTMARASLDLSLLAPGKAIKAWSPSTSARLEEERPGTSLSPLSRELSGTSLPGTGGAAVTAVAAPVGLTEPKALTTAAEAVSESLPSPPRPAAAAPAVAAAATKSSDSCASLPSTAAQPPPSVPPATLPSTALGRAHGHEVEEAKGPERRESDEGKDSARAVRVPLQPTPRALLEGGLGSGPATPGRVSARLLSGGPAPAMMTPRRPLLDPVSARGAWTQEELGGVSVEAAEGAVRALTELIKASTSNQAAQAASGSKAPKPEGSVPSVGSGSGPARVDGSSRPPPPPPLPKAGLKGLTRGPAPRLLHAQGSHPTPAPPPPPPLPLKARGASSLSRSLSVAAAPQAEALGPPTAPSVSTRASLGPGAGAKPAGPTPPPLPRGFLSRSKTTGHEAGSGPLQRAPEIIRSYQRIRKGDAVAPSSASASRGTSPLAPLSSSPGQDGPMGGAVATVARSWSDSVPRASLSGVGSSSRGGGGGMRPAVGAKDDPLVNELQGKSRHLLLVMRQVEALGPSIQALAEQVATFHAPSVDVLNSYVAHVESFLGMLVCERSVLKRFPDWPERRYELIRESVALDREMTDLRAAVAKLCARQAPAVDAPAAGQPGQPHSHAHRAHAPLRTSPGPGPSVSPVDAHVALVREAAALQAKLSHRAEALAQAQSDDKRRFAQADVPWPSTAADEMKLLVVQVATAVLRSAAGLARFASTSGKEAPVTDQPERSQSEPGNHAYAAGGQGDHGLERKNEGNGSGSRGGVPRRLSPSALRSRLHEALMMAFKCHQVSGGVDEACLTAFRDVTDSLDELEG